MDEQLEAIRERKRKQLEQQLSLRTRGEPVAATLDELDEMRDEHPLVLVDLWAPWCGPCERMEPILERVAERFRGHLVVAKVNVDEHPSAARRFQAQGVPTLLLFADGQLAERWVGLVPEAKLAATLDEHVPR